MIRAKNTVFILWALLIISSFACSRDGSLKPAIVSEIDGKEMVLIPTGEFIMGTNMTDSEETHKKIGNVKPLYLDQQPERTVYLDAYYIDRYEVTNREYKRFLEATQYEDVPAGWENGEYPEAKAEHPVTQVSWGDALAYALWAHKILPTEEQWEKAARGTDGRIYPWGNDYEKGAVNMGIDGPKEDRPVGSFPKDVSPYGVRDMAGNVMEWTLDWYNAYLGGSSENSRFGKNFKVIRGNGFQKSGHYFLDAYRYVFFRTEAESGGYYENVGFRCATPLIVAKKGSLFSYGTPEKRGKNQQGKSHIQSENVTRLEPG